MNYAGLNLFLSFLFIFNNISKSHFEYTAVIAKIHFDCRYKENTS